MPLKKGTPEADERIKKAKAAIKLASSKKSSAAASVKPAVKTAARTAKRAKTSAEQPAKPASKQALMPISVKGKTVIKAEEPLTAERIEKLRKMLLAQRVRIIDEINEEVRHYIKGDNRQLVESALDEGDWSVIDLSEDINLKKLDNHRDTLIKIDESLRKLGEGTYGICEECGDEIAPGRLKILPFAIFCRDCQERKEQFAAVDKIED